MSNYTNENYDYISGNQTVPASSTKTGTLTTSKLKVTGTGTLFKTEMPVGSWIFSPTAFPQEIRKVYRVDSDTEAYLTNPFTVEITATAPNVIHAAKLNVVAISLQIPSGSPNGILNGKTFPGGSSITIAKDSRDQSGRRDLIDPVIVDANGTFVQILIER